jgi:hypothetical protein
MDSAPTVLIGCSRLVDLAGAEINTLELAEAFTGLGWSVSVASFEVCSDMRAELCSLGARVVDLCSEDAFSDVAQFDLAWIHHSVTANRILAEPSLTLSKVIFSSLSHFSPLECPPSTQLQPSRYLVHSQENFEHFVVNYPELRSLVSVMNNSVLARYWKGIPYFRNGCLHRLAVVSNHLPEEVISLLDLVAADGIDVDVFGITGRQIRVSPDLLREYDAVITIGKTVQYAIAAGVPVYCYDHFGGYGWINLDNFQRARKYNFSGRGESSKISAENLKKDLYEGYDSALAVTNDLYGMGLENFVLENNIGAVLEGLPIYNNPSLTVTNSNIIIRQASLFMDLRREISFRDAFISDLRALLEGEKHNAKTQILYRDALLAQVQEQLAAEKENASSQILYRDALLAQVQEQLEKASRSLCYRLRMLLK